jgi:hypothetical protein
MGWQSEHGSGQGPEPDDRDPWLPETPGLAGFAAGGAWDICPPGPKLAAATAALSGPEWRCPGATDDELTGLLRRWAALESWAAAAKLGVIREMIRRDGDTPLGTAQRHGDLPDAWSESLTHELALALSVSTMSAERTAWLASELQARLPGIGALLATGTLTVTKARILADAFQFLSDDDAAKAEALIMARLAGKTPSQIAKLAARAAATVDPDLVRRQRENAQQQDARVRLWREQSGAASLGGFNLPTDEALAAYANVNARAQEYKNSTAFPDAKMDQLRVLAYLDLLNGVSAAQRITNAQLIANAQASSEAESAAEDGSADGGPGDGGPPDEPAAPRPSPPQTSLAPRVNLIIPLATLLGLADRPGEAHGLGPLDPALCLDLAATAANSARSEWCVTITDEAGIAIGHGCARFGTQDRRTRPAASGISGAALPARVNLTIKLTDLLRLSANGGGRDGPARWALTQLGDPGPPDGYGTWQLTLPGGRASTVRLEPVPSYECDHRHESHAYQPGDRLRHLVQVRDGVCTFPPCSRHARDSDFEHAQPFDKGGRTCGCNAGSRSRRCHRIKQSKGWRVTQPRPGWHQWETPSGRVYTQGPYEYPV